jgi:uncharacterized cupin superfamily protein
MRSNGRATRALSCRLARVLRPRSVMTHESRASLFDTVTPHLHGLATPDGQTFNSNRRELPLAPLEPTCVEEGRPVARAATLSRSPDGRLSSGLWECTAGSFRWTFWTDELLLILEGEATIREANGAVHALRSGDIAHFPLGLEARWEIPRYVRKFFVVRTPGGNPRLALWSQRLRATLHRLRSRSRISRLLAYATGLHRRENRGDRAPVSSRKSRPELECAVRDSGSTGRER